LPKKTVEEYKLLANSILDFKINYLLLKPNINFMDKQRLYFIKVSLRGCNVQPNRWARLSRCDKTWFKARLKRYQYLITDMPWIGNSFPSYVQLQYSMVNFMKWGLLFSRMFVIKMRCLALDTKRLPQIAKPYMAPLYL